MVLLQWLQEEPPEQEIGADLLLGTARVVLLVATFLAGTACALIVFEHKAPAAVAQHPAQNMAANAPAFFISGAEHLRRAKPYFLKRADVPAAMVHPAMGGANQRQ